MKQFKGTPGPWSTVQEYSDELTIVDSDGFVIATAERTAILQGWEEKGFSHWGDKGGNKELSQEEQFANACLISTAPELLKALQWSLPLAKIAMDTHRMERIKCGHTDIEGTYKNGQTWVGIYQKEVDEIESAQAAIYKALGQSVTND